VIAVFDLARFGHDGAIDERAIAVHIGRKTEVMSEERRSATMAWVYELRSGGLEVELVVTEYEPGRRGLTLREWTLIFIAAPAGRFSLRRSLKTSTAAPRSCS
jgi:hypothetical protein